ncbi:MAG: LPS export ABC transporter periplasmic protein LptC [Pseudomonadota bacterium]
MNLVARARSWLGLLPLLGILGATYWLNQQVRLAGDGVYRDVPHTPDAVVENLSATKFSERGIPQVVVHADKMQHYADDDSSELTAPRVTVLSNDSPAIHATAKKGLISSKGDEIYLTEHVEVLREASPQQAELKLETEYLQLTPQLHLARSDRAVTLRTAESILQAVGLEMDSQARTLKLLSQVRSEYVPSKN